MFHHSKSFKAGKDLPKIESLVGEGPKFFTRKGENMRRKGNAKMGVVTFLITLHFNHIYGVCRKSKVSFNTFFNNTVPQSFELAIQDSHPSLYITKKLYQFVYF